MERGGPQPVIARWKIAQIKAGALIRCISAHPWNASRLRATAAQDVIVLGLTPWERILEGCPGVLSTSREPSSDAPGQWPDCDDALAERSPTTASRQLSRSDTSIGFRMRSPRAALRW